ncbi:hypothetical protein [Streptomyces sp. NBC_01304]|uniref:hypothetical protein n=1 Tax=Streptomyces sp. NBC_01304 TaxID=2903818 RepID=UPI002E0F4847|nr:hypothetical protein OG430_20455 [Streptomyces sp. NBC_01304]
MADFGQLPDRAAYVAAFIDDLPEGAAMDAKTLAETNPRYGQQAVRSALNELSRAGYLRRVRGLSRSADGGFRWVTRTLWSRTAHDDEWWLERLQGDVPEARPSVVLAPAHELRTRARHPTGAAAPTPVPPKPGQSRLPWPADAPQPTHQAHRASAYVALAQLAGHAPQLTLSAADCSALADLAAEWLARGVTTAHLTRALTVDLPDPVRAPRAFVRHRLLDKLPPEPVTLAARSATHTIRAILECTECGVPGRPEALPEGLCRGCRGTVPRGGEPGGHCAPDVRAPDLRAPDVPAPDVHAHATRLRATLAIRPAAPQPHQA